MSSNRRLERGMKVKCNTATGLTLNGMFIEMIPEEHPAMCRVVDDDTGLTFRFFLREVDEVKS